MDLALRPQTLAALGAFRSRRESLLRRRSLLAWIACALALISAIALLDRAWLMPDLIRPWFSLAAYAASFVCAWKIGWQFIRFTRDQAGAALHAEAIAPEVREKLLAAVELAQADPSTIKDSPEFRARLQDEVAEAVKGIDFKQRQSASSLVPWAKRILLAIVVMGGLAFVPKLHFPGFLARAALPFANLPRPSSVVITVEKPVQVETLAAIASEVDIAVRIDGEDVAQAMLEYGEPSGSTSRMELAKVAAGHFESRLPVGQTDIRFRVLASDGISEWHRLVAKPRPRITQFAKTIEPPAYVGQKGLTQTDDHGDIEALIGSTVKLVMQCNQSISAASIVLNPDMPSHPEAPAVQVKGGNTIEATLPVNELAEAWTVKLTSAETGFSNDETTSWRITAVPDLPPIVQITQPLETQLSLLADESVRLGGAASDDVGLASVKLLHSINATKWTEIELAAKCGKDSTVQHLLALAPLQLKAGDTVLIKLTATDLKGQTAETAPLRVIILEQTIDPKLRQWAREQQRLAQMAKTLSDKAKELTKDASAMQKVTKAQKNPKAAKTDPETQLARFQQSLESTRAQADDLWEQLKKAAPAAPTKLDAEETKLLGQQVAKLRNDSLKRMEEHTRNDSVEEPEAVKRAAAETNQSASILEDTIRAFAADKAAKITAQAVQQSVRQQTLLTETSLDGNRDQTQRAKWQERQRAALAVTAELKHEFEALKEQVNGGRQNTLTQLGKDIGEVANDLRESLDKPADPQAKDPQQPKTPEHLYGAADNLRNRLQRSSDAVQGIVDETSRKAQDARQKLQAWDNPALAALDQAQLSLREAAEVAKDPKRQAKQKPDKEGKLPVERAQAELARASKQLQDQAELREQNPLTNTEAALDANRTSRAAEKIRTDTAAAKDAPALEALRDKATNLAQVARTLDADNVAKEAVNALNEATMHPQSDSTEQLRTVADAAKQGAEQLRQLPQAARKINAQEPANLAQVAADQARAAAQQLEDKARNAERRPPGQQMPASDTPPALADAKAKTEQAAAMLAQQADAARNQLLAMAPKVSDMMKTVAQDLRDTQKKTEDAKKEADAQKPVAEVADKAQAIQPEAAENAEKMQSLQAALRQEANAAELAKSDQRQLARTADVALEQMRQKSPAIQANLKQATQAQQSQPQSQALQRAAQAQQQTADALQQLAQNFAKMEAGEEVPQENLDKLAQMEQELGVKDPLDEAYDKAKELADVSQDAQNDPSKALADLEKQLVKNPAMQKALAEIAKTTAQDQEKALADKAAQPAMLGSAAEEAGHHLERVSRHEKRLGKEDAAKQVADASAKLNQTAKATKTEPGNATPQVAGEAKQATQDAARTAEQTAALTPQQANVGAFEQTQAQSLAQALDQLDAQMHPLSGAQQKQQSQQQGQQQQGQQQQDQKGAQQSLAQAQQSQQQSMAQARAQGKVPGQSQSNQQTAQSQQKNKQDADSAQQSQEGGNFTTTLKDGQMVLVPVGAIDVTDWGKLPARMAEDLTEATRQEAAPEYRAAIENYYKAIAERAKK